MIGRTTQRLDKTGLPSMLTTRRRTWWCGITLLLGMIASTGNADERPNILFIFADDLCFQNVHALGCDEIETPNLDRLVRDGLTFSHAYNPGSWSGAVCVASRTMLNTGRFFWQAEAIYKTTEKERQAGRFWSEYMRQAGYDTYFTGKWHVKANAEKAFEHVTHVRPGHAEPDAARVQPSDRRTAGPMESLGHASSTGSGRAASTGAKCWPTMPRATLKQAASATSRSSCTWLSTLRTIRVNPPRSSSTSIRSRRLTCRRTSLPEYPFKDAIGCGESLRDEQLAPFPRTPYAVHVNRQEYYAIITHMDAPDRPDPGCIGKKRQSRQYLHLLHGRSRPGRRTPRADRQAEHVRPQRPRAVHGARARDSRWKDAWTRRSTCRTSCPRRWSWPASPARTTCSSRA